MRVLVPSSLVSGLYTCLELLLTLLATQFISVAIRAWNVKSVYDDNRKLHLRNSKLNAFFGYGLSSRRVAIVAALAFTSIIALATTGGFSIVGQSGNYYQPTTAKLLVTKASPTEQVDYSNHISPSEGRFSGTIFLLFQFVGCRRTSSPGLPLVYEYINDLQDLTSLLFRVDDTDLNQTCVTSRSDYREQVSFQETTVLLRDPVAKSDCSWDNINHETIQHGELTKVPVSQQEGCRYPVQHAWCVKLERLFCAGAITSSSTAAVGLVTSDIKQGNSTLPVEILLLKDSPTMGNLRSAAAFLSLQVDMTLTTQWALLLQKIKRDVIVEKLVGERKETEINEFLLAATLGPALLILSLTGIVAFVGWIKYIVLPKRQHFNHFSSALDILSLGLEASEFDAEHGKITHREVSIGMHETGLQLGTPQGSSNRNLAGI